MIISPARIKISCCSKQPNRFFVGRSQLHLCALSLITTRFETTPLIDAVSEFGEGDGGSGGSAISRERGRQIKRSESSRSIHQLAQSDCFPGTASFSPLHPPAPQFLICPSAHSDANARTHTDTVDESSGQVSRGY